MPGSDAEGGVPLIEPEFAGQKKRKRNDTEGRREKKKRRNKKPSDINEDDLDEELGLNLAIGKMDEHLTVNYIARRTQKFEPDLSTVELEEFYLPSQGTLDTSTFQEPRTIENLPNYVKKFARKDEKLDEAPSDLKGTPHTIVITSSGIRAADLTRFLRSLQSKNGKVSKLFAKHIKMKEAIEDCKKVKMSIGVGTPQRVNDLLEHGALSSKHLKRIIIDASYIDQKKRGILDMKETEIPLVKLLSRKDLRDRYGDKSTKMLFF